ncbi:alpha/beta fold hydrolase [Actinocorallia herbida]
MHGTPGSRSGPLPRGIVLHRLGVRLLSYDRPGYGDSARRPGRCVRHAADDVRAIADHLGYERFSVVGRSGGGPHALACAALLPDRVTMAAVLVTVAPPDSKGLDWYGGMGELNRREYSGIDLDPAGGLGEIIRKADEIKKDPESLLRMLGGDLSSGDLRIVEDVEIREQLIRTYGEALKYGADGWVDDVLALRRPWGFDPSQIQVPTLLWHGSQDRFSPVDHTRWLAARIPAAETYVERGATHFGAVEGRAARRRRRRRPRTAGPASCTSTRAS